jgi:drug/metabolite transporter (DMT)-like permease
MPVPTGVATLVSNTIDEVEDVVHFRDETMDVIAIDGRDRRLVQQRHRVLGEPGREIAACSRKGDILPAFYHSLNVSPLPFERRWFDSLLAWYFVSVWGSGFVATKIGLQHAAPFTFLTLRFAFGILCLVPIVLLARPRFPASRGELAHVVAAGLLMHAVHLGGSHYAQYLGLSAGITALLLSAQPLLTAIIAAGYMNEKLTARQWAGIGLGLAGVALVVGHKIDVREAGPASLLAVCVSLAGVTAGTLYQRVFCPLVDLRSASLVQFVATIAVLAPLAWIVEDIEVRWSWALIGAIAFLVIGASILAVNALHTLMRRGQAARVTSLVYLTPIFAVLLEFAAFGVVPSRLSLLGIAVTCAGVALTTLRRARGATP